MTGWENDAAAPLPLPRVLWLQYLQLPFQRRNDKFKEYESSLKQWCGMIDRPQGTDRLGDASSWGCFVLGCIVQGHIFRVPEYACKIEICFAGLAGLQHHNHAM
jgi:hypothetical protein